MPAPDFPGRARLIDTIERAFNGTKIDPAQLKQALESLYHEHSVVLPASLLRPDPGQYLRRRIHASQQHGYQLIAMTWGPQQATPLHDHAGSWCVDCLWHGEMDIIRHDLIAQHDGLLRFSARPAQRACAGTGDWLAAPAEYHTMRNPHPHRTAVSLHVYPHQFSHCDWFEAVDGQGWHRRHQSELPLAAWE